VAKFQGDRSRDLGERVAKKKITSRVKHKPVRNYRSGRPNYVVYSRSYATFKCLKTMAAWRSMAVIDLGANRKPLCNFLLVISSNLRRILYRFRDIDA